MVEVFRELPSKPLSFTPNCSLARVVIRCLIPSLLCWSLGRIPPTQPSPASPLPPVAPELVFYLARAAVCWLGSVAWCAWCAVVLCYCCGAAGLRCCCGAAAVLWLWLWCGAVLLRLWCSCSSGCCCLNGEKVAVREILEVLGVKR